MNPLDDPKFANDHHFRTNICNQIINSSSYNKCFQIGEERRDEISAWFVEAFRQAMQQDAPDPKVWQRIQNTISLFKSREKYKIAEKWTDLSSKSKDCLLPVFLQAVVEAAGIEYLTPSKHFFRFYYGVAQEQIYDAKRRRYPKKIAPQLLTALSTPSSRKHELQEIFWDALHTQSMFDGHHGVEVEGAMPLNGSQLWYITDAKDKRPPPETLARDITIDDTTYPLSCLLARSSVCLDLYRKNPSTAEVATKLQESIPDKEIRKAALAYCTQGYDDFRAYMQRYLLSESEKLDLTALRAISGKVSAACFTIGAPKITADQLMGQVLKHFLNSPNQLDESGNEIAQAYWSITVDKKVITLETGNAALTTAKFLQLIEHSQNYMVALRVDIARLPESVRGKFTHGTIIKKLTITQDEQFWRTEDEVDPLVSTIARLEQLSLNNAVLRLDTLQHAQHLRRLDLPGNTLQNPLLLPPALEDLTIWNLSDAVQSCTFPGSLKKLSVSTSNNVKLDLSTLPKTITKVNLTGPQKWVETIGPRLSEYKNLTSLHLTLLRREGPRNTPMHILKNSIATLAKLWLEGGVSIDDLGEAVSSAVRKITFIPYALDQYVPAKWLNALKKCRSLKEFETVGPYGPHGECRPGDSDISWKTGKEKLLELAQNALDDKVCFTINGKQPAFLLENAK